MVLIFFVIPYELMSFWMINKGLRSRKLYIDYFDVNLELHLYHAYLYNWLRDWKFN